MLICCPKCSTKFSVKDELFDDSPELEFACSRCDHSFVYVFTKESKAVEKELVTPAIEDESDSPQIDLFPNHHFEEGEESSETLEEVVLSDSEDFVEQPIPEILESLPRQRWGQLAAQWPSETPSKILKADLGKSAAAKLKSKFTPAKQPEFERVMASTSSPEITPEETPIPEIEEASFAEVTLDQQIIIEECKPLEFSFNQDDSIVPEVPGCLDFGAASDEGYDDDGDNYGPERIIRKSPSPSISMKKVVPLIKKVIPLCLIVGLFSLVDIDVDSEVSKSIATNEDITSKIAFTDVSTAVATLADGTSVVEISSMVKNLTEFPYSQITVTARVFDEGNRPLGRFRLPVLSELAQSKRIDLFKLEDIKELQLTENSTVPLRPKEERLIKIVIPHYVKEATWLTVEASELEAA